jgi:hypothetical protein
MYSVLPAFFYIVVHKNAKLIVWVKAEKFSSLKAGYTGEDREKSRQTVVMMYNIILVLKIDIKAPQI